MIIVQKAQEISLALIKISVSSRRAEFRKRLEKLAFGILEDAGSNAFEPILQKIGALEALVRFGQTIYEIEPINAKILISEFGNMINIVKKIAGLEEVIDIKEIFSKNEVSPKKKDVAQAKQDSSIEKEKKLPNEEIQQKKKDIKSGNGDESVNSAIRQSAIVEKIRQSGNDQFQLKDFIGEFKEVSERTIRYDLQKLCSQGILERIGTGGPSTYYRIRTL